MKRKQFERLIKVITAAVAVVMFGLVVVIVAQFAKISVAKKNKQKLETQLSSLAIEETELKDAISRHNDLSYAENYAREHLGYIKDGDIIYETNQ